MYIVILVSIIAFFFTYSESTGRMKYGMRWGFFLITLLGCIHYNYGNDYMPYMALFQQVEDTPFNWNYIISREFYREPGWILLCYLFKNRGGFFVMVAVLNIVQNLLVYSFINKYVPQRFWYWAMFIYLFNVGFYLLSFSMMRQEFVVCVFLGLWGLIKERKFIIPAVVLYFCSWIHSSAILLVPFALWGFLPVGNRKILASILLVLIVVLTYSASLITSILDSFSFNKELDEWMDFYGRNQQIRASRGLGALMNIIPFFVGIYCLMSSSLKTVSRENIQLVTLALFGFFLQPFTAIIPGAGRIGYYFVIYGLAAIPIAYSSIRDKGVRTTLIMIYVVMTIYNYYLFFAPGSSYAPYYKTFDTIFSVL